MRADPLRTTIRVPMRAGHPSREQSMPRSTLMLRAPWAKRLGTAVLLISTGGGRASASAPRLDHVVVVIMENKSYDQVRTQTYHLEPDQRGDRLCAFARD